MITIGDRGALKNEVEETELFMKWSNHHHNTILSINIFRRQVEPRAETREVAKNIDPDTRDSPSFVLKLPRANGMMRTPYKIKDKTWA